MTWRKSLILFLLGLAVVGIAAAFEPVPGYMDAEYYYAGGIQLARGQGFQEPFLWNYLDNPAGLPHPSHTYWMPLPSILAAIGMRAAGRVDFFTARWAFLLLAALIPPLTARLSLALLGDPKKAFLAGLLALFPGFYLPYLPDTESFTLYMVVGALFLLAAFFWQMRSWVRFLLLGLLAGFMHLSRADGLIWLLPALVLALTPILKFNISRKGAMDAKGENKKNSDFFFAFSAALRETFTSEIVRNAGLVLLGYAILLAPWYARNLALYGGLFSPGGSHTLWLTGYNQTYAYPASTVNMQAWLASGLGAILAARWEALGLNLQNFLAVQSQIFLLPFLLVGLWRLRKAPAVWLGAGMWALTLGIMTVIFPFAGGRGGFLHSSAAVQPLFWAVTPLGLETALDWGVRKRGWQPRRSWLMFGSALVALSFLYTGVVLTQKVIGPDPAQPAWRATWDRQAAVEAGITKLGVPKEAVVMLNNPPGAFVASGRSSIAIPDADLKTVVEAARRYGATYLLLDENYVQGLADLYAHPRDAQGLVYLDTVAGTRVFKVE